MSVYVLVLTVTTVYFALCSQNTGFAMRLRKEAGKICFIPIYFLPFICSLFVCSSLIACLGLGGGGEGISKYNHSLFFLRKMITIQAVSIY